MTERRGKTSDVNEQSAAYWRRDNASGAGTSDGGREESRPWWQKLRIEAVRERVAASTLPELRGLAEEMKAVVEAIQIQIETFGPELLNLRQVMKQLSPGANYDDDKAIGEIAALCNVSREAADELLDDLQWYKSVRNALGYIKEKRGVVTGEIARRRGTDAEQALFDVKGKIKRAAEHLRDGNDAEARRLVDEIEQRLEGIGP